ncbi:MAG: hypothetical protein L6Q77_04610 [Bacteroidetes bacterium]|nr:hypothetical protein [Bacteroidota bacterium]
MILDLDRLVLRSEKTGFTISLEGNFRDVFGVLPGLYSRNYQIPGDSIFLIPFNLQFRPGDGESVWLDWTEAEREDPDWNARFILTLSDRILQAANEICRRSNEFEIILTESDAWPDEVRQIWISRLSTGFTVR